MRVGQPWSGSSLREESGCRLLWWRVFLFRSEGEEVEGERTRRKERKRRMGLKEE